MSAMTVFTMVIKFLKEKLIEQTRLSKTDLEEHEILWTLTVPAIWSDAAKQFMREAAINVKHLFCFLAELSTCLCELKESITVCRLSGHCLLSVVRPSSTVVSNKISSTTIVSNSVFYCIRLYQSWSNGFGQLHICATGAKMVWIVIF